MDFKLVTKININWFDNLFIYNYNIIIIQITKNIELSGYNINNILIVYLYMYNLFVSYYFEI